MARRRRANWGRRIKVTAVLLIVVVAVVAVFMAQRALTFNAAVSTEGPLSQRLFGPFSPERVNVLLLGYSDESHGGAYLSDSMNVLSIRGDETTVIPIPRDLWVEGLPQVPDNMKINEALAIGYYADGLVNGGELAADAVGHVTGLPIHGWIALDFQGFEAMVNAVGGVTIENPTAFSWTWAEEYYAVGQWEGRFEAGTLDLNGQEALTYARNRYTSEIAESSDFARSVRQQRVLEAIRDKVAGWQIVSRGMALADALDGHLRTNLSVWDLGLLAIRLGVDRRVELAEDVILQAAINSEGQYVLVVIGRAHSADYAPLHAYLETELGRPLEEPVPTEGTEPAP